MFQNNTSSTDGGALHLDESSLLQFKPDTRVAFINNTASQRGGAVYIDHTRRGGNTACFIKLDRVLRDSQANVQVVFEGNHAGMTGDALYDGRLYLCAMMNSYKDIQNLKKKGEIAILLYPNDVIESLFSFTHKTTSHSLISSDPLRICFCSNESEPDFGLEQSIQKEAYPGQMFNVQAVAVGLYNGTTPDVVLARVVTSNTTSVLREICLAQQSKRSCTRLQYSITSINEYEVIQLVPAGVYPHIS